MKLHDILESQLLEITQNPSVWTAWVQSEQAAQIRVGFEAEMIFPVSDVGEEEAPEADYSDDPTAYSIDDVVEFWTEGDFGMTTQQGNQLREKMQQEYLEHLDDVIGDALSEQGPGMIRKLARQEGFDEEQIDELMDEQDDDYHKLADEVRQELTNHAYENVSERDWLRSEGMDRMSDVESHYNLTWPRWSVSAHNEGALEDLAQEIEQELDVTVYHSSQYHTAPKTSDAWVLEPDSSLKTEGADGSGLELVTPSPPPFLPDTLVYLDKLFAWAQDFGCYTNRTTGFHMNMSLPEAAQDNLDPVKLILLLGDQKILADFGRTINTYANSAFRALEQHVKNKVEFPVDKAMESLRTGMHRLAGGMITLPYMGKYISVHLKRDYVEFRHAGGDYLDKLPEIKMTLLRMAYTLSVASDDAAAKTDYARKLYKMLSGFSRPTRVDNMVNLFSLYSAGVITQSELKAKLQQLPSE